MDTTPIQEDFNELLKDPVIALKYKCIVYERVIAKQIELEKSEKEKEVDDKS